jgi:hypothetical protein
MLAALNLMIIGVICIIALGEAMNGPLLRNKEDVSLGALCKVLIEEIGCHWIHCTLQFPAHRTTTQGTNSI